MIRSPVTINRCFPPLCDQFKEALKMLAVTVPALQVPFTVATPHVPGTASVTSAGGAQYRNARYVRAVFFLFLESLCLVLFFFPPSPCVLALVACSLPCTFIYISRSFSFFLSFLLFLGCVCVLLSSIRYFPFPPVFPSFLKCFFIPFLSRVWSFCFVQARVWVDLDMLGLVTGRSERAATRKTKSHNGVVAACALQCLCQLELLRGGR